MSRMNGENAIRRSSIAMFCLGLGAVGCGDATPGSIGDSLDLATEPAESVDMAIAGPPRDMARHKPVDLATAPPPDLALAPITGSVGPSGGKVSRLFFAMNGDTRGTDCNMDQEYPTQVINQIYDQMNAAKVEFAVDLGDHMFVCQNGTQNMADTQMGYYVAATKHLAGKTTFLTLGNHDCVSMTNPNYCAVGGFETVNFRAFMNALAPISSKPYYSVDIQTDAGLARFVFIADNAWSQAQKTWLEQTLGDADKNAKYTIVVRHHPLDNTDMPDFQTISGIVKAHKYTLHLTGHTHEFRQDHWNDGSGRTFIIGNGGAPLAQNFTWYGYATVEQVANGNLVLTAYDAMTNNPMGSFTVAPQ